MPKVVVTIFKSDGHAEIEVDGASGPGCAELTKRIEDALGGNKSTEYKPEWHDTVYTPEQAGQ